MAEAMPVCRRAVKGFLGALRPDDEPTPVEALESRNVDAAGLEGGVDDGGVHDDNTPPPPTTSFS